MNPFIKKQLDRVGQMLDSWMERRKTEIEFPADVEEFTDIPYRDSGKRCHMLDIYRPKNATAPLPVIVDFHGGGMVLCTKEVNRSFCAELAKRGFLVFCVDYPLVPDADIPIILGDVSRGMDFVDTLIEQYGGDRNRIYQMGDSAGAFLSIYAVAAQKNPAIAEAGSFTASKLPVKALGLISGMFYTTVNDSNCMFLRKDFYGKDWKHHPMSRFFDPAVQDVAGNLPACFLVTSGADSLRQYTMKFHKGLTAAKTPCELLDFPMNRALGHDFVATTPEKKESQQAIDRIAAFLLEH